MMPLCQPGGIRFLANGIDEAANNTYARGNVVVRQPELAFRQNSLQAASIQADNSVYTWMQLHEEG